MFQSLEEHGGVSEKNVEVGMDVLKPGKRCQILLLKKLYPDYGRASNLAHMHILSIRKLMIV